MSGTVELLAAARAAGLVGLAELGDKSQLVCLVLGARFGAGRVTAGAALAFGLLNALAVGVGGALEAAVDPRLTTGLSAALFAVFGALALRGGDEEEEEIALDPTERGGVATTFGLLFVAELGDKTQLLTAALAAEGQPAATWVGSTVALIALSAVGAALGRAALERIPVRALRRLGGALFLLVAAASIAELIGDQ